jgi:hypothetical protein
MRWPPNKALKLTRLSGCLLGGPGFGEDRAMQRPCPSSAVQLNAGVRWLKTGWELLAVVTTAVALGCSTNLLSEKPSFSKADAYATAILAASSGSDVDARIKTLDPTVPDRSHLLEPLFSRIASGNASPAHWQALCRVDMWGDGAWHLEMKAAAYGALVANPTGFARRYLGGDDCALLLLSYAFAWPRELIEMNDTYPAQVCQFDSALQSSLDSITSRSTSGSSTDSLRDRLLLEFLSEVEGAWACLRSRVVDSCNQGPN